MLTGASVWRVVDVVGRLFAAAKEAVIWVALFVVAVIMVALFILGAYTIASGWV